MKSFVLALGITLAIAGGVVGLSMHTAQAQSTTSILDFFGEP